MYVVINTIDNTRYEYGAERYESKVASWTVDYCKPEEVACRVERDGAGNEVLVPLHRKQIFKKWSNRN